MEEAKFKWPNVCMAVLNWNGRHHLEILIPSLLEARARYLGHCRIVILDNPSGVDDLGWVRSRFPEVDAVAAPENDFLYSYNWLLEGILEPIVILLNNDLRVAPDFLAPLVEPFQLEKDVFAVSAKSLEWDGSAASSEAYMLGVHHGWVYWDARSSEEPIYTVFAVGGFMAVDRAKFLQLGGFDRLYTPAYGEDSDLCLKAWRCGWPSVYQPRSVVWHREGASWDGKQAQKRNYLMTRAQYLINCRHFNGLIQKIERAIYLRFLSRRKMLESDEVWLTSIADAREHWRVKGRTRKAGASEGSLAAMEQRVGRDFPEVR